MATVGPAAIAANSHRMGFSGTIGHRIRAPESVAVRTQFNRKFLSGQRSQTELECSRCVVLISNLRAFVLLRARADASRDVSNRQGLHHNAMRRPDDRRIFTMGHDE